MELAVPRSRSACSKRQFCVDTNDARWRWMRRYGKCFCWKFHPDKWSALATLLDEAVSAATVSAVSKVLDQTVADWHRRLLTDTYRYLIFDGVSVRIRLVGKVQRRVALCAYGIGEDGQRELIDFFWFEKRQPRFGFSIGVPELLTRSGFSLARKNSCSTPQQLHLQSQEFFARAPPPWPT